MKKTKLLKTITDIFYFVYAFCIAVAPIIFIVIMSKMNTVGFIFDEKKYTGISFLTVFFGLINYGVGIGFLYCLYLFRKVIRLFLELHIFHPDVILYFRKIGKWLVLLGIVLVVTSYSPIGYSYITSTETGYTTTDTITHHFEFLHFKWAISIAVGLFFMVLSEIFDKAKRLKEENDLTV